MPTPHPALSRALRAIADAAGTEHEFRGVTVEHAITEINDDVLIEWAQREGGYVAALRLIADRIEAQLEREPTDDREGALIQCLARNLPPHGATVHAAFVKCCAEDLASEAFPHAERIAAHVAIERKQMRGAA